MSNITKTSAIAGLTATLGLLVPYVAYAAPRTFADLVNFIISLINPLAMILASLAVLVFFWGIVKYIYSSGGEGHEKGRQLIVWGVISLFVLFSVWSLANIVVSTFLGGSSSSGSVPTSSYSGGGLIQPY